MLYLLLYKFNQGKNMSILHYLKNKLFPQPQPQSQPIPQIGIHCLDPNCMPTQGTDKAGAWDIKTSKDITFYANETHIVETGIIIKIPEGYKVNIKPRSGLSAKGFAIKNSPGLIDEDYCGPKDEVKVILNFDPANNQSQKEISFKAYERIAQLDLQKVEKFNWVPYNPNTATDRGGLGSTGTK
jgi:dUTP pyrophosphatase